MEAIRAMRRQDGKTAMRFDRAAPGGGVEALCRRLESGRVFLEWKFHLVLYSQNRTKKIVIPNSENEYCDGDEETEAYDVGSGREWTEGSPEDERGGHSAGSDRSFEKEAPGDQSGHGQTVPRAESIRLRLTDRQEEPVLECILLLREEEPLQSILPQPEIWQGIRNPYLYKVEAVLTDEAGNCLDRISSFLPLRNVECRSRDGKAEIMLNGESLEARVVRYSLPQTGNAAQRQQLWAQDLGILRKLGANCILLDSPFASLQDKTIPQDRALSQDKVIPQDRAVSQHRQIPQDSTSVQNNAFLHMCDRLGFLVFTTENSRLPGCLKLPVGESLQGMEDGRPLPIFRGMEHSFFVPGRQDPAPLFYRYRAKWSKAPFVYLIPESVKRLTNGNYTACCYSSCSRVALYSDGRLFEFKSGELVFEFREIPCGKPTILLTAEAEGCSHSLSIHKSFTKQSPNDDIFLLE